MLQASVDQGLDLVVADALNKHRWDRGSGPAMGKVQLCDCNIDAREPLLLGSYLPKKLALFAQIQVAAMPTARARLKSQTGLSESPKST